VKGSPPGLAALADSSGVRAVPVPGNAGVWACEGAHDPVRPTATYLRRSDRPSWVCHESFRQLWVTDFEGRAKGVGSKGRRAEVRIEGSEGVYGTTTDELKG
jgi:hypothetical protein